MKFIYLLTSLVFLSFSAFAESEADKLYKKLMYSSSKEKIILVKKALEIGIDVNAKDLTLLHIMATNNRVNTESDGSIDIVKLLIKSGAKLDSRDLYDRTPLAHAVGDSSLEMVKVLVEAGADTTVVDIKGEDLPYISIGNIRNENYKEILEYILSVRKFDINKQNRNSTTFLELARKNNDLKLLQRMIDYGGDVNVLGDGGMSLLMAAATKENNVEILSFLLEDKLMDINAIDKGGNSVLHYASGLGNYGGSTERHIDNAKFLIEKGADLSIQNLKGYSALDIANYYHDAEDGKEDSKLEIFLSKIIKEKAIFDKQPTFKKILEAVKSDKNLSSKCKYLGPFNTFKLHSKEKYYEDEKYWSYIVIFSCGRRVGYRIKVFYDNQTDKWIAQALVQ